MTVHTLKQCRPDQEETEYFWKLFHAAQRNDARWHGSEISIIADELSRTDLDRNQKLFLLRSWQVLVDDKGGFGRFMGAFDTYVYNIQDPDDDCVAWKPELAQILNDCNCFDVLLEAYQEAQQRIAELEAREVTLPDRKSEIFWPGDAAEFDSLGYVIAVKSAIHAAGIGVKQQQDSVDSDVGSRNQPGMVVAVHIDAGDFVKVKGQVFEVEETDFDDHDVTLWFVGGNALKCSAGCPVEVVSAPVAAGIKVKE
ncbi:hypothetical protein A0P77_12380 [Salmonella enterica]|uniref:Ead/Ea22-like family protein n=2 Tax=Salmonella enterica TaxID=28901 RepID=A0A5W8K419_SALTM|nr:hypothetical protein [Salmonella enterica]EAB8706529.1 hypothetical protein [Salmonella enterica subsp. enterica serovar Schwarzengrund]EBS3454779.1 hypothetical protein [Salmonella enterica subsp. enterica serovar Java]EBU7988940.1 hypothetical protein [Salmonella enterica subsp. enterica serovar Meleagridis]EBZ4886560.1 hypothetical protein [Salmonella enterica subsp. enterica serovar Bredeney]ECM7458687.1 hypothetical protein [Salmonella enterica subsp. enterica serovar Senftenberg]EDP9